MHKIVKEVIGFCPAGLTKVQIAKWIHSKYPVKWDEAHYHALHAVVARSETRIKEIFSHMIGVEADEDAMQNLFTRSLSPDFDYVCDYIEVDRLNLSFQDLIMQNL